MKAANVANVATVADEDRLTHIVSYVAHDDRYEALRKGTSLPFIVFGETMLRGGATSSRKI